MGYEERGTPFDLSSEGKIDWSKDSMKKRLGI